MMRHFYLLIILSIGILYVGAQDFPTGTNAIHKDSTVIVGWATNIEVVRGYIKISDTTHTYTEAGVTSNRAWAGTPENALGAANGSFVSFGDGGYAILQFENPIGNGPGPDFAVFENAMFSPPNQNEMCFVELAFVEVSSDGENYERFPAVSQMQYHTQVTSFQSVEWSKYHNFAGIFPVFYAVPFDLDDIHGELVDKNNITHIKIIDAVGCVNPEFATYDAEANIVNCSWPTPFNTGGFDLDAVGVIHFSTSINNNYVCNINIYPNPATEKIRLSNCEDKRVEIYNGQGNIVKIIEKFENAINIGELVHGIYFIRIFKDAGIITKKLIKI
jgi:hypothetical protein